MSKLIEIYRGYEILSASPEYGKQFAYAWRTSDESSLQFCSSVDECKEEIDILLHDRAEYEKDKQS